MFRNLLVRCSFSQAKNVGGVSLFLAAFPRSFCGHAGNTCLNRMRTILRGTVWSFEFSKCYHFCSPCHCSLIDLTGVYFLATNGSADSVITSTLLFFMVPLTSSPCLLKGIFCGP